MHRLTACLFDIASPRHLTTLFVFSCKGCVTDSGSTATVLKHVHVPAYVCVSALEQLKGLQQTCEVQYNTIQQIHSVKNRNEISHVVFKHL